MQLRFGSSTHSRTIGRGILIAAITFCFGVTSVPPVEAEPPPWAPAWGYRAKQGHGYKAKGKSKHRTVVVQQAPTPVLPTIRHRPRPLQPRDARRPAGRGRRRVPGIEDR